MSERVAAAEPVVARAGGAVSDRLTAAVAALSGGEPVVLAGDATVLVLAAQLASPRWVATIVRHTSGVLRFAAEASLLDRLGLDATGGVDAAHGVQTGVSAADRARTLRVLADRSSRADDLVHPGHVFPVQAGETGHGEAAVTLLRLAQLRPAAALAELLADDGGLATPAQARRFAEQHALEVVTADDLHHARSAVLRLACARLPTRDGQFRAEAFATLEHPDRHHLALVLGDLRASPEAPVYVHLACPAGERFGSLLCDCAGRLRSAMQEISAVGAGVVVYLRGDEEAMTTGLPACPRLSTAENAGTAAAILHALGVPSVRALRRAPSP